MSNAPLGRSFDEMVQARVGCETAFAEALLEMAVPEMLTGDLDVARSLIRDVIKPRSGSARRAARVFGARTEVMPDSICNQASIYSKRLALQLDRN